MNLYAKELEFDKISEQLSSYAISAQAKEIARDLTMINDLDRCNRKIQESEEAKEFIEKIGLPPIGSVDAITENISQLERGDMWVPEQFEQVLFFISACERMKSYLKRGETLNGSLAYMGREFGECPGLREEIERCIRNGAVDDFATPLLHKMKADIDKKKLKIREKLESYLSRNKECFADSFIVQRNGRSVLPVKKEYKNKIKGTVNDISSSGNTLFMEPDAITGLQSELQVLEIEEDNEIRRILYELTDLVAGHAEELKCNATLMQDLDFIFAKGKLAAAMKAEKVLLTKERDIRIEKGRHPLLDPETCVPLDFLPDKQTTGVVITGPNTGGKTVALKTVGLLSVMAQCGLLIPAGKGSSLCLHRNILCDIGDGQNMAESLSTFSSHIKNIIRILEAAEEDSLVLLDELGSGTDPAEGMGIAVAILEALRQKGCLFLATTHYPEVKEYAETADGLINARMTFDKESLKPQYTIVIGEAGESCALYIAKKLGFPEEMTKLARKVTYGSLAMKEIPKELHIKARQKAYQREKRKEKTKPVFCLGDSVMVEPEHEKGIVCNPGSGKGEVQVQIKRIKKWYKEKRVKLLVPAAELYPPDYDFAIIFDTVENRKASQILGKRYDPNVTAAYQQDEPWRK